MLFSCYSHTVSGTMFTARMSRHLVPVTLNLSFKLMVIKDLIMPDVTLLNTLDCFVNSLFSCFTTFISPAELFGQSNTDYGSFKVML